MGDFDKVVTTKYSGALSGWLLSLYHVLSNYTNVENGVSLYKNPDCYKIICFDVDDDVVDVFASLHHQVAEQHSKHSYSSLDWK